MEMLRQINLPYLLASYPIVRTFSILAAICGFTSMIFRNKFHDALERFFGLALSKSRALKLAHEVSRKSFHLIGLIIIPLVDLFSGYSSEISATLLALGVLAFVADEIRLHWQWLNDFCQKTPFMRPSERNSLTGVPTFLLGISVAIFFQSKIAIYALLFGDTAAALGGIAFGRTQIGYKKTLEGFGFFVLAVVYCCRECHVSYIYGLVLGVIGGVCELYCKQVHINDNLLIPLGVALGYFILQRTNMW